MNDLIREDGYVNMTKLCVLGGKRTNDWFGTVRAKTILDGLSKRLELPVKQIYQTFKGGNKKLEQGTWIHPHLATIIAQWISWEVALDVSEWIEEWKNSDARNNQTYNTSLCAIVPDIHESTEKEIQLRMQKELDAESEVKTGSGYIDLLTDDQVIEIKYGSNWKHAIGQVYVYGSYYPDREKRIHLFGIEPDSEIERICTSLHVEVTYE
jgi:hypothetical protein